MSRSVRLLAPRYWGAHLLALVLVATAAWLGFWQLDAWHTRRAAEATDLTEAAPVPLADTFGPDDPFPGDRVGQPVDVVGTWLPEETMYVAGRTGGPDAADGVWAVTPVLVDDEDAALLVVRGWAADSASAPTPPSGRADLVGLLQPSDASSDSDPEPGDDVLPALRVADVLQRVEVDLYGGYVVGTAAEPGLAVASAEQLPEAGRFTALRNLLYALEWWVFGAFAAFIWWRHVRDQLATEALAGSAEPDAVPSEP